MSRSMIAGKAYGSLPKPLALLAPCHDDEGVYVTWSVEPRAG